MAQRGPAFPNMDPTATNGTDLAVMLNQAYDALDTTNSTEEAVRPPYAQRGTLWLDVDVGGNTSTLKMFTGLADAVLFTIDNNSGEASINPQRIDFVDKANSTTASIRLENENLEFWPIDSEGLTEDRQFVISDLGCTVEGKLNIGYGNAGNINAMSVIPNVNGAVQFNVTSPTAQEIMSQRLSSYDVNPFTGVNRTGVIANGSVSQQIDSSWQANGLRSSIGMTETFLAGSSGQFFLGNLVADPYYSYFGNEGLNTGVDTIQVVVNRTAEPTVGFGEFFRAAYSGTRVAYIDKTGNVAGTGAYTNLSDESVKREIKDLDMPDPEDAVMKLKPREYYRPGSDVKEFGFIAQEVQKVLPNIVKTFHTGEGETEEEYQARVERARAAGMDPNTVARRPDPGPDLLGVQTGQLVPILIAHIKKLTKRVRALECQ